MVLTRKTITTIVPTAVRVVSAMTAMTQEGVLKSEGLVVVVLERDWVPGSVARARAQFFPVQLEPEKVM